MKDESCIVTLPVDGKRRGCRFDKIFFQEGINIDEFNCMLVYGLFVINPIMINDNYEVTELSEEFQQFKKHRCIEDRSNKTIKTMTGYEI
jgi:hypothetical protein